MNGPYADLRVLDLTHVIAGPLCTRLLADMGADVVKVESRAGDLMRALPTAYAEGMSTAFAQYNCGKRSIGIDLKHREGLRLAERLVGWADVVAENFSPGAMDRLGLGWDRVHELNPRAILLSISLFGRTGPYAAISGFGTTPESYSGLMPLVGGADAPPSGFGTPLADMSAGVHALAAVGAALHLREGTGEGSLVDISSFDCLFTMIDQAFAHAEFHDGARPFRSGGSCIVRTVDGEHVTVAFPGDAAWVRLTEAMGRPDLLDDPRFADQDRRGDNRLACQEVVQDWCLRFANAAAFVAELARHQLSAARIRRIEENIGDPHLTARGTLQSVDFAAAGRHAVQSAPYVISGTEIGPRSGPPTLAGDTDEVLRDLLDLDQRGVQQLRADGAVFGPQP